CGKPNLVANAKSLAVRRQEVVHFLAGITLLGGNPARERLAIVVEDHSGERLDFASNHDPMTVALVTIGRVILSIKHSARRIKGAAQRLAADTVHEARHVSVGGNVRSKLLQLRYELITQYIVGIE